MTKKLIIKPTNYGAYREILKDGNKILGWIEQYLTSNLPESEKFFYAFGKPSQSSYISFTCGTLKEAEDGLLNNIQ